MASIFSQTTQSAKGTPFDNSTNGFTSTNVQSAIEEVNSKITTNVTLNQTIYVNKSGNDTTGNGSFGEPYLTIAKAISSVTDASPTKRYGVLIGAGDYNENLSIKANLYFIGTAGPLATRITGSTIDINDSTWNIAATDNRSGFQDISVNPTATWDFTAQANNTDGKLYFWNIRTSGAWTVTANSSITQLVIQDSEIFGTLTFNGCNTLIDGTSFQGANLNVNSAATSGPGPAIMTLSGGNTSGNITATWTSNGAVTLNLYGIAIASNTILTATGASCVVYAASDSLPIPANRSVTSSATLNRLNDNYASGLISTTTNITTSAATAPTAGQVLIATSSTAAHWGPAISLTATETSATASATAGTGADALLTGMTITPAAGTYLVWFSCDLNSGTSGAVVSISFYVGGSQKADSLRKIMPFAGGTLTAGAQRVGVSINGLITVNGSQAIEVRWSSSSGAPTAADRTLNTLRVT